MSAAYRARSRSGVGLPSSSPWLTCSVQRADWQRPFTRQHRIESIVDVARNGFHRRNGREVVEHVVATDIAGVNDEIDVSKDARNVWTQKPVRVGDQPNHKRRAWPWNHITLLSRRYRRSIGVDQATHAVGQDTADAAGDDRERRAEPVRDGPGLELARAAGRP